MLFTDTDQFTGNKNCDAICTFDHECQFDEVCRNRGCVKDESIEWQCSSGRFKTPEMACRRVNPGEGMFLLSARSTSAF